MTPLFPNLAGRADVAERMDDPQADPRQLARTLAQFRTINRFLTRERFLLRKHVISRMVQEPDRVWDLLEIGSGGCHTAVWLLRHGRKLGLHLRVTACDHDPRAVAYARRKYPGEAGLTLLEEEVFDAIDSVPADFVFANHFLHHLSEQNIVECLRRLGHMRNVEVVLTDLRRSHYAYLGFFLLTMALFKGGFVREDGLMSIRRGFTVEEMESLVARAGSQDIVYSVSALFPARIAVIGRGG